MNSTLPIGIFDSGIGGLTVLDKLIEKMPAENYIYIADQGHCPYGTKTDDEIKLYCKNVINYLSKLHVKAIVVACNTASNYIDYLQSLVDIPVISVIEPTSNKAIKETTNNKIGVIATNMTIKKGKYQTILKNNGIEVFPIACSEFVELVENEVLDSPYVQNVVNNKLNSLKNTNIDTLIYGCTHFGLLEKNIKKVLGNINYIESGDATSLALFETLKKRQNLNLTKMIGNVQIYTTGSATKMKQTMSWFKKHHNEIQEIKVD